MKSISLSDGKIREYFYDGNRIIQKSHLVNVCKIHQKEKTCKYIFLFKDTNKGWVFACSKKTPLKQAMDARAGEGKSSAQSDNCEGLGSFIKK